MLNYLNYNHHVNLKLIVTGNHLNLYFHFIRNYVKILKVGKATLNDARYC
jgi:hypothetical protein